MEVHLAPNAQVHHLPIDMVVESSDCVAFEPSSTIILPLKSDSGSGHSSDAALCGDSALVCGLVVALVGLILLVHLITLPWYRRFCSTSSPVVLAYCFSHLVMYGFFRKLHAEVVFNVLSFTMRELRLTL
jgi:hypothetical protein